MAAVARRYAGREKVLRQRSLWPDVAPAERKG